MCGKSLKEQRSQVLAILSDKQNKDAPYLEQVQKPDTTNEFHLTKASKLEMKTRLHMIHKQLMQALEESRKQKGLMSKEEIAFMEDLIKEPFDPEMFVDK